MGVYREGGEFVERCFCEQPATRPCACCSRARCDEHLVNRLCNRCDQAVARSMKAAGGTRWWTASSMGAAFSTLMLCLHVLPGTIAGLPLAVAVSLLHRATLRARFIREAGPIMRASKGELRSPARTPDAPVDREKFGRYLI